MVMHESVVTFDCYGETLVGILHRAAGPAHDIGVVVIVGGPQYRVGSHRQFVIMARAIAKAGWPVLRFDYRGMGDSAGQQRSFSDVGEDICAAVDCLLREEPRLRGVVLYGLCDAASAVFMYCGGDRRVRGAIAANPWVRTEASQAKTVVRHYYGRRLLQRSFWAKALRGEVDWSKSVGDFFRSLRILLTTEDGSQSSPAEPEFVSRMCDGLLRFSGPVLIMISGRDLTAKEFVDLGDSSPHWRRAVRRKTVRILNVPAADHTFSVRTCLDESIRGCLEWLNDVIRVSNAFQTGAEPLSQFENGGKFGD
jgi:exosortase A-associated hydrolase 1